MCAVKRHFGGGRINPSNVPVRLNRLTFDNYQTYQMHINLMNDETLFYISRKCVKKRVCDLRLFCKCEISRTFVLVFDDHEYTALNERIDSLTDYSS